MSTPPEIIYLGNDTLIVLENLAGTDGVEINTAVVEVTLFDANETEVSGQTWPLALPSVGGGRYEAVLDKAVQVELNGQYDLRYTVSNGPSDGEFWNRINAIKRFP